MIRERLAELTAAMQECDSGDIEADHALADQLLCQALRVWDHEDVGPLIEAWERVPKWYA